ncbi:MAG: sugar transferase [Pseudomonadota bacterium]
MVLMLGSVMDKAYHGGASVANPSDAALGLDLSSKRLFDIAVSLVFIVLFSWVILLAALAVKLETRGPAFFRQTRTGHNGRLFRIWKLRTMTVCEDGGDIEQATRDDERVTFVGKFLRCTSVDELPQLLNVLNGDMSLVGPRPHACAHDREFSTQVRNYADRFAVRPGITGLAQVAGFRGETKTAAQIRARVRADRIYIENRSFGFDLLILLRTVFVVIWGRNAY